MDPRVQEFIARTEADTRRRLESAARLSEQTRAQSREETLIRLGLCEREETEKVPLGQSDWRWDAQKVVYYRYKALSLSEEEYRAVLAARDGLLAAQEEEALARSVKHRGSRLAEFSSSGEGLKPAGNRIALLFRVFAWVLFILGANLGIVAGGTAQKNLSAASAEFDVLQMIWIWIVFFVLGMLFYGVSEALTLLQRIADQKTKE